MTHDDVLALCQRWQDAVIRRDLEAVTSLYADDAIVESPLAGTTTGREAFLQGQREVMAAFPDLTLEFEPPVIDGDRVSMVSKNTGTHTGTIMGLPPSGRPIRFRMVFLWEVRDGRIVRDRRVYDFTGLLIQLGVLRAKPA